MSWRLPDPAAVRALRDVLRRRFASDKTVRQGLRARTGRRRDVLGEGGVGRLLVTIFLMPMLPMLTGHAVPAATAGFLGLWWLTMVALRTNRIDRALHEPDALLAAQVLPVADDHHARHQLRQITPASVWLGLDLLVVATICLGQSGHLSVAALAGALVVAIGLSLAATACAWWLAGSRVGTQLTSAAAIPLVLLVIGRFIAHDGNALVFGLAYDHAMTGLSKIFPPAWLALGLVIDPAAPLVVITSVVLAVGATLQIRAGQCRVISQWRIPVIEPPPSWQVLDPFDEKPVEAPPAPDQSDVNARSDHRLPDPLEPRQITPVGHWLLRRLDHPRRLAYTLLTPGGLSFTGRWRVGLIAAGVATLVAMPGWPELHWLIVACLGVSAMSLPLAGGDFPGLQFRQHGLSPLAIWPLGLDHCLAVMARVQTLRLAMSLTMLPLWILAISYGWSHPLADVASAVLRAYGCVIAMSPALLILPFACQKGQGNTHIRFMSVTLVIGIVLCLIAALVAAILVFAPVSLLTQVLALLGMALAATLCLLLWRHAWRRGWFDVAVPPTM